MKSRTLVVAFTLFATIAIGLAPTASAHKTTYSPDGKVKIVWGFLNEPATTWTKTGLDLILSDNATGTPITGAESTLQAHLKHGDKSIHFDALRGQHGKPGAYSQAVTLTKSGIYTLHLKGTINGSAVEMDIPSAHEIHGIEETFFPPADVSPYDAARIAALEAKVAALEAKAKTASETPATVTPQTTPEPVPGVAIGLLALAAVGVALLMRRRS